MQNYCCHLLDVTTSSGLRFTSGMRLYSVQQSSGKTTIAGALWLKSLVKFHCGVDCIMEIWTAYCGFWHTTLYGPRGGKMPDFGRTQARLGTLFLLTSGAQHHEQGLDRQWMIFKPSSILFPTDIFTKVRWGQIVKHVSLCDLFKIFLITVNALQA